MFRCEYFKSLKIKDPVKYNQISKKIGSYNQAASNAWKLLDEETKNKYHGKAKDHNESVILAQSFKHRISDNNGRRDPIVSIPIQNQCPVSIDNHPQSAT